MRGYNVIIVYNENVDKILMCKRKKDPYKGLANFVGGKIEKNENGLDAAYRELEEETTITKDDIMLLHIMDFTYYIENYYLEVYVGKLNKIVDVNGTENKLFWSTLDKNFFDETKYAEKTISETRVDYDKVEHLVEFLNEEVVNGGIKVRIIQRQIENANDYKIIII